MPPSDPRGTEWTAEGWTEALGLPGCLGFAQSLIADGLILDCMEQIRSAVGGPGAPPPVTILESVFEALFPDALAWQQAYPHPQSVLEGNLKPRFLLLKLLLDLAVQEAGPGALKLSLVEAYLERKPASQAAQLLLADLLAESGRADEAVAIIRRVGATGALRLLPQHLLQKVRRGRLASWIKGADDQEPIPDLEDRFCAVPFDDFQMDSNGSAWACCPGWLPVPLGNYHDTPWDGLWNSNAAMGIRRSILDGDFQYCSHAQCPKIAGGSLPRKADITDPAHRRHIDGHVLTSPWPRRFVFAQDPTCNLACPQCRETLYKPEQPQLRALDALMESCIRPILGYAACHECSLLISGNGDPFASRHYMEILAGLDPEAHKSIDLQLLTNGLRFKWAWDRLPNIHRLLGKGYVGVSVDAASRDVYRTVRGGDWDHLLENLRFISKLRKEGTVSQVILYFAVQTCNYKDMAGIIQVAADLGFDRVEFHPLRNEGTYRPAEFQARTVYLPSHPEHQDLLKELRSPLFAQGIVELGALRPLLADAYRLGRGPFLVQI